MTSVDFEKLGAFYLGRAVDPATDAPRPEPLLYDSRDLVTHAAIVGMTGSGKTGLCVSLIEEAAIDGVPVIAIDPKGDLGNLLLTFPELRPADFEPYVDPSEATRRGLTASELAAQTAERWRKGLAEWDQKPERIARLQEADRWQEGKSPLGLPKVRVYKLTMKKKKKKKEEEGEAAEAGAAAPAAGAAAAAPAAAKPAAGAKPAAKPAAKK